MRGWRRWTKGLWKRQSVPRVPGEEERERERERNRARLSKRKQRGAFALENGRVNFKALMSSQRSRSPMFESTQRPFIGVHQ